MLIHRTLPRLSAGHPWPSLSAAALALRWLLWAIAAPAAPPRPRVAPSRAEAERRFAGVLAVAEAAIWRLCRFREKNPDACRDLYQEIALSIWQALPNFRGEASERTWALRVAHNVAATHVGRAVRQRKLAPVSTDEQALGVQTAAAPGTDPERRLDLLACLAALDLPSQELVLLHLEGLTTREIADVTGLTPTNVTTRLNRLRQRLSAGSETPEDPTSADAAPEAGATA
jgi:RNA polymerase sigma-70 factor, ECF subfamily